MTTRYPGLTDAFRLERWRHPAGPVRMVLDTDAYNEIDDQFNRDVLARIACRWR